MWIWILMMTYLTTLSTSRRRAAGADRTASAHCCRRHLPVDSAERQQHQRGRPHYRAGGGVPHRVRHHVRPAARRQDHAQNRPPGSRHRVRDQRPADQTSGGRHRCPGTATEGQDQMCWWVDLISRLQAWRLCSKQPNQIKIFPRLFFFSAQKACCLEAVVVCLSFQLYRSLLLLLVCVCVCASTKD